jgi:hypothetical protein
MTAKARNPIMDTSLIIGLVVLVAVVLILVGTYVAAPRLRSGLLRRTFGPEYDRAVTASETRRDAERDLRERRRRHRNLRLHDIPPERRREYTREWARVQERFVDAPTSATQDADTLVDRLVVERGYDDADRERRLADMSVRHPHAVDRLRRAREIHARAETGGASTDELRDAMVHYRILVDDLLGDDRPDDQAPEPAGAERRPRWHALWSRLPRPAR